MTKDMSKANVKKMVKHDCAKHVMHEKWGRGECIPEMHTIVETADGEGYVTHYDIWFEHGIEMDVPVESLTILESMSHGHTPKKKMSEALIGKQKKIDANHNGKIDGQDFKILRAKKKMQEMLIAASMPIEEDIELIDEEGNAEYMADLPNMHKDLKAKKKSTSQMRREYGSSWKRLMHHTNQHFDAATRENAIKMAHQHMNEEVDQTEEEYLLNNLYLHLDEENQEIFLNKIETEEGLEEMLHFAKQKVI